MLKLVEPDQARAREKMATGCGLYLQPVQLIVTVFGLARLWCSVRIAACGITHRL